RGRSRERARERDEEEEGAHPSSVSERPALARKRRARLRWEEMTLALLLLLTVSGPSAWADSIRVIWDGVAEAAGYELQAARDEKYTDGVETFEVAHSRAAVTRPAMPKFARIRARFGDGSMGQWVSLKPG